MLMCRQKFVVELFFEAKWCDKFKDFKCDGLLKCITTLEVMVSNIEAISLQIPSTKLSTPMLYWMVNFRILSLKMFCLFLLVDGHCISVFWMSFLSFNVREYTSAIVLALIDIVFSWELLTSSNNNIGVTSLESYIFWALSFSRSDAILLLLEGFLQR